MKTPIKEEAMSGLGLMAAVMLFSVSGLLFILTGIYVIISEYKKVNAPRSVCNEIAGIVFIGVGVIVGMGALAVLKV